MSLDRSAFNFRSKYLGSEPIGLTISPAQYLNNNAQASSSNMFVQLLESQGEQIQA